jgi:DNA ligase-1
MFKLPTLYKKNNRGSIQEWTISWGRNYEGHGVIHTRYGQLDGAMQEASDVISEGKNVGKKNETSPVMQAKFEAESKWEKQKKKGYVEKLEDATDGVVDEIIEGGTEPMLAQSFDKHGHKILFPCFAQPKLDGIRCIAMINRGQVSLWTRTRKRITSMPHIEASLSKMFPDSTINLDGELYNHDYKKDFEKIASAVRKENPEPGHEVVQYHIYDMVDATLDFNARFFKAKKLCRVNSLNVRFVETSEVANSIVAAEFTDSMIAQGFEGAMLRNKLGVYESKRSYNLQKVKRFDDGEFRIVGITEGRGKLRGHVGAFICLTEDGTEFEAKLEGHLSQLKAYFDRHELWEGKKLTVRYQGFTNKNNVPRFPVGVVVRDYE